MLTTWDADLVLHFDLFHLLSFDISEVVLCRKDRLGSLFRCVAYESRVLLIETMWNRDWESLHSCLDNLTVDPVDLIDKLLHKLEECSLVSRMIIRHAFE